jgi:energy-coupling factor transporter ATP-binding protein EcfA2
VTVIFGPNGAGKSNILEALAWTFEDAAGQVQGPLLRPRPGGNVDEDALPAFVNVQLDRSDESGSPDQSFAMKLLSRDGLEYALGFRLADLGSSPTRSELDELFRTAAALESPSLTLAHVISLWSRALAELDGAGSFDDRFALAHAMLDQRAFSLADGVPIFIPAQLDESAREAAKRIAADEERLTHPSRMFDPLLGTARAISQEDPRDIPMAVGDVIGEPLVQDIPELVALASGVWMIDGDPASLGEGLIGALDDTDVEPLQERANALVPRFVAQAGEIILNPTGPDPAAFRERDGEIRAVTDLGAGIARWVAIATRAALRERADRHSPVRLWLLDEPEAHLHLNAIRDLRDWLVRRNNEQIGFVVATHALELLDLPPTTNAHYLLLTRRDGELSQAIPAEHLLASLEAWPRELGIGRADALRLARGVLVVEGPQDAQILHRFYENELSHEHVLILPLHGMYEALALVELEYLSRLELPIVFLCDNVRADFLRRPRLDRSDPSISAEERKVFKVLALLRRETPLHITSHSLPDILFALPPEAVREVVGGDRFTGWDTLRDVYTGSDPKDRLAAALGQRRLDNMFIERVLEACQPDTRPAAALENAMRKAFSCVARPRTSPDN